MKMKSALTFIIAALLIIGSAACTRSLPGAPEATSQELPADSTAVIDTLYQLSTQTAMAAQQGQPSIPLPAGEGTASATGAAVEPTVQTVPSQTPLPTAPPILAPTATPGLPTSYTLQKGEFPFCIARRFDINPNEMLQLSGLAISQNYPPGTVLRIPQNGSPFPGSRTLRDHPASYTVQTGDTIYSIACLFGDVDPESIAFVNNLAKPYTIKAGQTLNIP